MTIDWKAAEQYFTVKLFVFQFYPVCNFGLGTVRSELFAYYSTNFLNETLVSGIIFRDSRVLVMTTTDVQDLKFQQKQLQWYYSLLIQEYVKIAP